MLTMSRRFVIQIHSGYGPTHYDFMIEAGEALATWQLAESPAGLTAGTAMPARRLADHRREYLTYEGPVSRGRGRVDILDAGECEVTAEDPLRWEFRLAGRKLAGLFELTRAEETTDAWTLRRKA